jgi:hypothetical protein
MKTAFLLMAQYDGAAIIPAKRVCEDYFSHLKLDQFLRQTATGEIKLPIVRMTESQKAAKGVHVDDLADYLDARRKAAKHELEAMTSH